MLLQVKLFGKQIAMDSVRPKKKLGQHFLKDENIALKIVGALQLNQDEKHVLEIGPGTGVLTKFLIEKPIPDFKALDVDDESVEYLKKHYPDHSEKFHLQDFLKSELPEENFAVIGNFPYNISSQIFFKIYDYRNHATEVVGMIQKEVADRISSKEGNKTYGILSVLLQAFYEVEYLFTVPPGVFNPPPKVKSAVIRFSRNNVEKLGCNEVLFKRVVKEGFQKRRKTLWNSLKNLNLPESLRDEPMLTKRAEQLSVNQFIELTKLIEQSWNN